MATPESIKESHNNAPVQDATNKDGLNQLRTEGSHKVHGALHYASAEPIEVFNGTARFRMDGLKEKIKEKKEDVVVKNKESHEFYQEQNEKFMVTRLNNKWDKN
ncbi:MAG: hypothetical protein IM607_17480 [Cytophagales bacterium]|nr:hypothetical protein [Cytophagales bacterium]